MALAAAASPPPLLLLLLLLWILDSVISMVQFPVM